MFFLQTLTQCFNCVLGPHTDHTIYGVRVFLPKAIYEARLKALKGGLRVSGDREKVVTGRKFKISLRYEKQTKVDCVSAQT